MSDPGATAASLHDDAEAGHLAVFDRAMLLVGRDAACRSLAQSLDSQPAQVWLQCARALLFRHDLDSAAMLLRAAVARHAGDEDLRFALAGVQKQSHQVTDAEALLRELLTQHPGHAGAGFLLAQLLREQARYQAMAETLRALFTVPGRDTEQVIKAVELLDDAGRQADAAAICEAHLAGGCADARVHAYAGMLQIQLGQFERARASYLHAIAHDARAFDWTIAVGLSSLQRYADTSHPDFALFRDALARPDIEEPARASLLFALAKAHDDIAEYATAAQYLSEANGLIHGANPWPRKRWQRAVQSRLSARPWPPRQVTAPAWTPVFIVGVPRSGTTLVAEWLARYPDVRNRGELAALPRLEKQLEQASRDDRALLEHVALAYRAELLQDDAPARWYVDKEPLNLLRVDLIMSLYPNARIIICRRNARDTAVSLWSQHFSNSANGYAYDLADTAAVIKGCSQLSAHWQARYPDAVRTIGYEHLTANAAASIRGLAAWLGLPESDVQEMRASVDSTISTGSLWQARQPVYQRSVERWKHYAPYLPALLRLPADLAG